MADIICIRYKFTILFKSLHIVSRKILLFSPNNRILLMSCKTP